MTTASRLIDIGEVARMLDARAEALCRELLPHGRREGAEWVALNPVRGDTREGSFRVHLSGAKAGVWRDFAADIDGDMLDLVAYLLRMDKSRAFSWARRWLGLDRGDAKALEEARRAVPSPAERGRQAQAEQDNARNAAFRIWLAGAPELRDTPVDRYLRGRDVALAELQRQPAAIRFHPQLFHKPSQRRWPAMVTAICGPDNKFAAVHRTWLEVRSDGRVTKAPLGADAKMVLGTYRGGSIHLWRGASGKPLAQMPLGEIVDLTEGIEDGLSVVMVAPECRVLAAVSLSNLANVVLPAAATRVRLWRQNDDKAAAIDAFRRAAQAHLAAGREVLVPRIPESVKDVNDLLRFG